MSRAAKQDVQRSVLVPIMISSATTTHPASLIQSRTPFRAGDHAACVAGLGTPRFVNFLVARAIRNRLVREHASEGRPRCVADAFRHLGFGEFRGRHIADSDVVELSGDARRELVQEVRTCARDACVHLRSLSFLLRPLGYAKLGFQRAEVARIVDDLAGGQSRERFQAEVNTNSGGDGLRGHIGHIDADVQEPVSASIPREVGAVLDLGPRRQRAAFEHFELSAVEVKAGGRFPHVAATQRNPSQRFLAAPTQVRSFELPARLRVLLTDLLNGAGVHLKLATAAGRQIDQVERRRPLLAPLKRVLLGFVAEVPDEGGRSRLLVQQATERLHAVAVRQDHRANFTEKEGQP